MMELSEMKSLWKAVPIESTQIDEIVKMINEKSHPVLQKIKRQLVFEMLAWTVVIVLYHSAFDGNKRPAFINLAFVIGFMQAIAYNLSSYFATRNLVHGKNLTSSMKDYIKKLKKLQWTAICSRIVLMGGILMFFCYNLDMTIKRMISLGCIVAMFVFFLVMLYLTWTKRISKLTGIITSLSSTS
ncbi:hypothetical protein ACXZ1K_16530 [Pedobacter sp. PWIIR3]